MKYKLRKYDNILIPVFQIRKKRPWTKEKVYDGVRLVRKFRNIAENLITMGEYCRKLYPLSI